MLNLTYRSTKLEVMDDLYLPSAEIDPVLKGLGQLNKLTGNHKSVIKALKHFSLNNHNSVADWGCGGGDTLIAIAGWAQKNNINLKLKGIDAAPAAIKFAEEKCKLHENISFEKADVLADDPGAGNADIVICGLFTHHFADDEWVRLIKKMYRSAKKGVIITDLHRHWLLYYSVRLITWLTCNKMVKADGPLSVERSFKRDELIYLLDRAQITNYRLRWLWPFKWQVVIYKS